MSDPSPAPPCPAGIPAEDWACTPRSVQDAFVKLEARVAQLEAVVRDLVDRLGANSSNSSKPPSSDFPATGPRQKNPASGRRRGGQKGHPGSHRELAAPEHVTGVMNYFPGDACEHCGGQLTEDGEDPDPVIHQVTDILPVRPEIIEHRRHRRACRQCGRKTLAQLPAGVPTSPFGPGVEATVAYYTGGNRCSRRDTVAIMQDVHHVDVSLGAVKTMEERVSAALAPCVDEAAKAIQESAVIHQDETGWREGNSKAWLWVASNLFIAVFVIARSRKGEVSKRMLGKFNGILVTDRFKGYLWYDMALRAICHAHLKRDFQRLVDRGGVSEDIGSKLLAEQRRLFDLWHQFKSDPELDWKSFYKQFTPIRARTKRWLRRGAVCSDKKTRGVCKDILRHFTALWTFIYEEGVEPTNNHAEQVLRKPVLWRKNCFGTQSESGSRFAERILTVLTSCRLQGRNFFAFLVESLHAAQIGTPAPTLLPA